MSQPDSRLEELTAKDTEDAKQRSREPSKEANEISHAVVGAAIEVHRTLGPGYIESIYERALAIELNGRGIGFDQQVTVPIIYRDTLVGEHRLDMLVGGLLVVEIKAIASLTDAHFAQVLSYLKATNLELALLFNFHARTLVSGTKRVIRSC